MELRQELLAMRSTLQAVRGFYPRKLDILEARERKVGVMNAPLAAQGKSVAVRGSYPSKLDSLETMERGVSEMTALHAAQIVPECVAVPMDPEAEYMDRLNYRINSVPAEAIEITSSFRR
ncbi:MAG: hypothetical protein K2J20_04885 [Bacilli bacterium]|nr:hypothetical protein [Bacilli bacterium]